MIQIQNTIISEDILDNEFVCNLTKCKGQCCIDGNSGAPLEKDEVKQIEESYPFIKKYLPKESIDIIEKKGFFEIDDDGDLVTPLVKANERCVYVFFDENNFAKCAFEKAYLNKEISFVKPISCHLYPIRITNYPTFKAVNYDRWDICNDACMLGRELKVSVVDFLKTPLIRAFGEEWYKELELINEYRKNKL
ncbi:MAG: DUF3109 family protein [Solirubrobacteraceae bacterium]